MVEGAERMPPSPAAVINPATPLRPVVDLTEDKAGVNINPHLLTDINTKQTNIYRKRKR